jgi:hypothetical protein
MADLSRVGYDIDDLYFHNGWTADPARKGLDPQLPSEVEGMIYLNLNYVQ